MVDFQNKIYDICKKANVSIGTDTFEFEYSSSTETQFTELSIDFENIRSEKIIVYKESFPINIYKNFESYLKINEIEKQKSILILNLEKPPFSLIENITYINFKEETENYFFENAITYSEFIKFIKTQDIDSEDAFHFVDYVNSDNRKIVFTSLSEKGRIILKYYNEVKHFDEKINYNKYLENFKNCFNEENSHLPKFLKNSIIEFTAKFETEGRIFKLFENLNEVTNIAKVNFEIYLNNLSIDRIRKDYEEYKSKFFKELSEILSNLTQKIIGLPIIIAATLFAIERVKENFEFLYLIIFIILVTNVYLVLILKMNFKDLTYIKLLCEKDYSTLKDNKFFTKQPHELKIFTSIYTRITERIKLLRIISEAYYWILCISNTLIIMLILHYIKVDLKIILFMSLVTILIMSLLRNDILNEKENKSVA